MFRLATSILSPGGERGRLSAFIFHRVLPRPDPLLPSEPDAEQFDRMLGWIGSQFNVLPPLEACERLFARSLPRRAAIITFDDGYRDNHDVALPILKKHRMKAVFFIATGYLNGGMMFNDRVIEAVRGARTGTIEAGWLGIESPVVRGELDRIHAIERLLGALKRLPPSERDSGVARITEACGAPAEGHDLMMNDGQLRVLRDEGMELGGHTQGHPILTSLADEGARREIDAGRDDLRAITGERPQLFAYPNGKSGQDFNASHCAMVEQSGFRFAFTTDQGASGPPTDRFLLKRHTPWARRKSRFQLQAVRNLLPAVR